jgi:molybdopterin-guanine dinucleotide biosynthesis protein A
VAGLRAASGPLAFATSCDAPLLRPALIRLLADLASGYDVVCPEIDGHLQPLVAVYRVAACRPVFERALAAGTTRLLDAYQELGLRRAATGTLREADARLESFLNVNHRDDLAAIERLLGGDNQP